MRCAISLPRPWIGAQTQNSGTGTGPFSDFWLKIRTRGQLKLTVWLPLRLPGVCTAAAPHTFQLFCIAAPLGPKLRSLTRSCIVEHTLLPFSHPLVLTLTHTPRIAISSSSLDLPLSLLLALPCLALFCLDMPCSALLCLTLPSLAYAPFACLVDTLLRRMLR